MAQDTGSPPLRSERQLVIEVTDENDCRPVFTADNYTVTVAENNSPGRSVFQLTAVDADQPGSSNSRITYHIRPKTDTERPVLVVDPVCYFKEVRRSRMSVTTVLLALSCLCSKNIKSITNNKPESILEIFKPPRRRHLASIISLHWWWYRNRY